MEATQEYSLEELLEGGCMDFREVEDDIAEEDWFGLLDSQDGGYQSFEITGDMEDALRDMDRRKELDERRTSRIADCGKWAYWFNPHYGRHQTYRFSCDLFRECERCLKARAKAEMEQLKKLVFVPVAHLTMDSEKTDSWLRKIDARKSDYIRYPQKDGTDMLLVRMELAPGEPLVEPWWYHEQDWASIVDTPAGRNRSGNLHANPPPSGEEEYTVITTMQFITDADWVVTTEAMRQVIEDTKDYRPTEPQYVVSCLKDRTIKTINKLKAAGYEVTIYKKRFKLVHSKISWEYIDYNTEIIPERVYVPLAEMAVRAAVKRVLGITEPEISPELSY